MSAPAALRPADLAALKSAARVSKPKANALPTIADLAAEASGIDWPGLIAERFGAWAAGYFDEGQALWAAPRGRGAYAAWRAVATHDLTPEIVGLPGFAIHVSEAPETALDAVASVVQRIAIPSRGAGNLLPPDAHDAGRLGAIRALPALAGGTRRRCGCDHHRFSGDPADLGGGSVRPL